MSRVARPCVPVGPTLLLPGAGGRISSRQTHTGRPGPPGLMLFAAVINPTSYPAVWGTVPGATHGLLLPHSSRRSPHSIP